MQKESENIGFSNPDQDIAKLEQDLIKMNHEISEASIITDDLDDRCH